MHALALSASFLCVSGLLADAARAAPGAVAAFSFDEGAGTTLHDLSGHGNTGTISGAAWTTGRVGNALEFDGVGDSVTVPDSASLDPLTGVTIEAWVRPGAVGGPSRAVAVKDAVYALYASDNAGMPSGHVYVLGDVGVRGTSPLPLLAWTHVAMTWDATTPEPLRQRLACREPARARSAPAVGERADDRRVARRPRRRAPDLRPGAVRGGDRRRRGHAGRRGRPECAVGSLSGRRDGDERPPRMDGCARQRRRRWIRGLRRRDPRVVRDRHERDGDRPRVRPQLHLRRRRLRPGRQRVGAYDRDRDHRDVRHRAAFGSGRPRGGRRRDERRALVDGVDRRRRRRGLRRVPGRRADRLDRGDGVRRVGTHMRHGVRLRRRCVRRRRTPVAPRGDHRRHDGVRHHTAHTARRTRRHGHDAHDGLDRVERRVGRPRRGRVRRLPGRHARRHDDRDGVHRCRPGLRHGLHARRRRLRRRWQPVGAGDARGRDGCVPAARHPAAHAAGRARGDPDDADDDHARLVRVDRRHRRRRLRGLPGRRRDRVDGRDELHRRRPCVRAELHVRGRRVRRGRQSLGAGERQRRDRGVPERRRRERLPLSGGLGRERLHAGRALPQLRPRLPRRCARRDRRARRRDVRRPEPALRPRQVGRQERHAGRRFPPGPRPDRRGRSARLRRRPLRGRREPCHRSRPHGRRRRLDPGCGVPDYTPCPSDADSPGNDLSFVDLRVLAPYDGGWGGAAFYCASCSNVAIVGGVWGPDTYLPCHGSAHPEIQSASTQAKRANHILIDGATFQNYARCDGGDHTECLQVEPADDVTIRNSVFRSCDTITVNFANDLANSVAAAGFRAPNDVLIENSFFDAAHDNTGGPTWYALNIRECTNCTVRYNSWLQAPRMPTGEISLDNRFVGNAGPMSSAACDVPGVVFAFNVWEGAQCDATDRDVADVGFVDPAGVDLHLRAGSPAIDAGDPSLFPAVDIDGQLRPIGGAPDAGADETPAGAVPADGLPEAPPIG